MATAVPAAERDLSVAFIAREPRIDYVWNSSNPTREGWPEPGSEVRWVAHVRWLGSEPLRNVGYRWLVDGEVARTGTLDFKPEALVTTELPRTWTFERSEIVFEIDPARAIDETEERNNRVALHTDSLGIAFYVERTFWDGIGARIRRGRFGANTFDDWVQKRVRHFNEMAAYAIYPETPRGVLDRWRIDAIHIVEDGALPLVPPYVEARDWGAPPPAWGGLYPNVLDHTVDMQWGYPAFTVDYWSDSAPWNLTIGNATLHELAHARTMIDVYAWNLTATGDVVRLDPAPPAVNGAYYSTRQHGMMHFDWGHIDRYSAIAMNRMAGRRALSGNYNEPWDLGFFLNDLPSRNRVRLVRPDGSAIANRAVRIYRVTGEKIDAPYGMVFDATPDLELTTDAEGVIEVGRNPFAEGDVVAFVDRANGVAIVEILDGETRRWAYLDSLEFNLAYWRGNTAIAEYEVMADAPVCNDDLGPSAVTPSPEAVVTTREVLFHFPAARGREYVLFIGIDGELPHRVEVPAEDRTTRTLKRALPPGRVVWWFEDEKVAAPCPARHSSIYAFDHESEAMPRRRSIRR
ncbi:MAG TPA: hypothetical protein VMS98_18955 [Thermoanaerobaculia bacterium]|nr:hypothetical protein [Thermoanaerobaculia bacterium]